APSNGIGPGSWSQIASVGASVNFFTDTGRTANTTYWYRVRAFNWLGNGAYSASANVTIVPPAAPNGMFGTIGTTNQVNLSWNALYPYEEDGFKIERAPDAGVNPGAWTQIGAVFATNVSSAQFTDTNVVANTTNWYRVRAFNVVGNSDYSLPVRVDVV